MPTFSQMYVDIYISKLISSVSPECDYCIHVLLNDTDILSRDVQMAMRKMESVSVGLGAFNKLAEVNSTVSDLQVV